MPAIRNATLTGTGRWTREVGNKHYMCRRCGILVNRHQTKKAMLERPKYDDPRWHVCADCRTVENRRYAPPKDADLEAGL